MFLFYLFISMVSLSELNISANDLERLPPSIGLLRHLRTLYADENFIVELPSEVCLTDDYLVAYYGGRLFTLWD